MSDRTLSTTRARSIAWLALVFVLGGVAGAAVGRTTALRELEGAMRGPPAEARARFRVEAMRRHLDLSEEQVDRLSAIFAEADAERDRQAEPCRAGLSDLRERTEARVVEVLTPAQAARYRELGPGRPRGRGHPPPGHPPPPFPPSGHPPPPPFPPPGPPPDGPPGPDPSAP